MRIIIMRMLFRALQVEVEGGGGNGLLLVFSWVEHNGFVRRPLRRRVDTLIVVAWFRLGFLFLLSLIPL